KNSRRLNGRVPKNIPSPRSSTFGGGLVGQVDPLVELGDGRGQPDRGERQCRLRTANDLGHPPVSLAPQHFSKNARGVDKEYFLHARYAAVIRYFGLPIVQCGSRRQYFDDQQRILKQLLTALRRSTGYRKIGDVTGVVPVWPGNSRLALTKTGGSRSERGINPRAEPQRQNPVCNCRRRHRHRTAPQQ